MSSPERRKENAAKWERQQQSLAIERARKEAMCLFDRIEESDASTSVKDILHRLATGEREC